MLFKNELLLLCKESNDCGREYVDPLKYDGLLFVIRLFAEKSKFVLPTSLSISLL